MVAQPLLPSGCMTPDQRDRYSRQIRFEGLGDRRAGEACWPLLWPLWVAARLGVFTRERWQGREWAGLILIDRDYLEISNLQRQWLYEETDVQRGLPKAAAAAAHVRAINSACVVDQHIADLIPSNADELLEGATVILDGCDNFETRYLINDYAVSRGIPWVYGGAVGSYGIVMPVVAR